jgi:hypothetical protein
MLSFSALDLHLKALQAMDAAAFSSVDSNVTKAGKAGKKGTAGDDGDDEKGKKRKAGGGASHGVAQLKKANTTGMKKMTSFFSAAAKKA